MPNQDHAEVVREADIVLFFDSVIAPEEGSPRNQIGIIADDHRALFAREKIYEVPLRDIHRLPEIHIRVNPNEHLRSRIAQFFLGCATRSDVASFKAGLRALRLGNMSVFQNGFLFPPSPFYVDDEAYEAAWVQLKQNLHPFDVLFTVTTSNTVSRSIALMTGGCWSHVAMHVSEGYLAESTFPRMRAGPIELYKGRQHRVAGYRHLHFRDRVAKAEDAEQAALATFGQFRQGYNWREALRHGWMAFRGDHDKSMVPNSMIYKGEWMFVGQA